MLRKILGISFALLLLSTITGCSKHPTVADVTPQIQKFFLKLMDEWNHNNLHEFIAQVNATEYLANPAHHAEQVGELRQKLGRIKMAPPVMVSDKTSDKAAAFVAIAVMTTERGVLRFTVAFNKTLEPVGYNVTSNSP